ncbi:molybdenum ABC transporter ATP-binding protein [Oceanospirillum sediminis]|uniref:Molybdenum ABC transporter ATP-binding protein n=1 Tax=Oceanospirillum sediminis TaxID=2760088 RepID=A0A839IMP6_9GAMM|nr:molybdenum ABC transporter ATP-binding protein [Oceanospirillum sediminis]MBB1486485.1 molybdenum ABC transporter ATP-binding protein [Oceanospirillum sediminis]
MSLQLDFRIHRASFELNVQLQLPNKGVTVLFGRSGSGKTTLLRCIAGLEYQADGKLRFNNQIWQKKTFCLPVHQRPLGYVFQEASLFPHLNVLKNMQFGWQRVHENKRSVQFEEVVQLLGLGTLLNRYPSQLSGGQRQRVALGCALLTSPELLLMDEPMASLDSTSKADILPFLEMLKERLQLPVIYVTHSMDEVTRLADHLVYLQNGEVLAQGPLQQMLTDPDLPFISTGQASTVLQAQLKSSAITEDYLAELTVEGQRLFISQQDIPRNHLPRNKQLQTNTHLADTKPSGDAGSPIRVRVMARDVVLATSPPQQISLLNCLQVRVMDIRDDNNPSQSLVRLALGQQIMLARISRRSITRLGLKPDQQVYALIKGIALN